MRIIISGVPGTGKTTISKKLSEKLNIKCYNLNKLAKNYKINIDEDETINFDLDKLLIDFEKKISQKKDYIAESHFSHFIQPKYYDLLIILNRDLKELKEEYEKRGYKENKIKENLEAESFNICYFEALEEGTPKEKILNIENKNTEETINTILNYIKKNS